MFVNRAVCVIEKSVYRNSVLFFCTCLERNKYEAALRKSVLIFITYDLNKNKNLAPSTMHLFYMPSMCYV